MLFELYHIRRSHCPDIDYTINTWTEQNGPWKLEVSHGRIWTVGIWSETIRLDGIGHKAFIKSTEIEGEFVEFSNTETRTIESAVKLMIENFEHV